MFNFINIYGNVNKNKYRYFIFREMILFSVVKSEMC